MGEAPPKHQINFLRGWPHPSLLPTAQIQSAANAALSNSAVATPGLLYGPDPGYQPLRESIAGWLDGFYEPCLKDVRTRLASRDGPDALPLAEGKFAVLKPQVGGNRKEEGEKRRVPDPERICITGGASQNLACILQVYSDPLYTRVWMVAPCYFLACRIFADAGLKGRAVPESEEGVDLPALEKELREADEGMMQKPLKEPRPWSKIYKHIIYCVPTFSNPSGKTMTLSNRVKLVELARQHDALLITDDVYDFLQWPTSTSSPSSLSQALLPRLIDIDRTLTPVPSGDNFGNAVSNGSFSKIAGPGVRTGWAEASRKFTYGLSQAGSSRSGGAPSQMTATIMNELLSSSALQTHIETVLKPAYQKRYVLMMDSIKRELVPLGVGVGEESLKGEDVFGGYFIWLELPESVDAGVVAARAKESEDLIVAPGKIFEVEGDEDLRFPNGIRLCFSWEDEVDLVEGVERLARVVKAVACGQGGGGKMSVDKRDLGEFS